MALLTLDEVRAAAALLAPVVHRTPIVASRALAERCGLPVWLKCENLQRTGSFKPRGAYARIARLGPEERARGVVAASAGNHAQGVAWAASEMDVASTVFMPVSASLPKVTATKAYGAEVRLLGSSVDEALGHARRFADETGAVLIHPFDHPDVILGQATCGLEVAEQLPEIGTLVVPLGGGGLLAGMALAVKALLPGTRVVGVQAEGAAAWPESLRAGAPVALSSMATIADGIAIGLPGAAPFEHVSALVDEVVTVSEEALSRAVLLCLERLKLVVEPAGAAAVAALMTVPGQELGLTGQVCGVLTGGNVDPLLLTRVIAHGLRAAGRYLTVRVRVRDQPGGLAGVLAVFQRVGASVVDVTHSRIAEGLSFGDVEINATVETRGSEHQNAVLAALAEAGLVLA
ncbi:threonine ammonia-lyase [Segniliparus rugosus]|uniref:threonine ammonia-lyase n=1 Tax=Segniliparus rugosus (strain ATCC BAA-974 / DSM 45345 / CCUG 50838 / CIP 108380 / JCM 13579 / CDC 945) TaxID=679197 RepID=U1LMQ0_SEGRC|nr:threonine ammonia-lyase [Segniliparus rugosus]ERG69226.1 threonine dehydratase [Segniliparus rugosus ATCC BAA-974]